MATYTLIDNVNIVATNQSSAYASNTADKMFDGLLAAGQYWLTNTGAVLPQWASWDYGSNVVGIVGQYEMQCNSIPEPLRMPKDWTLQGSANNIDWDIIDTVVGETAWSGSEKHLYTCDVATTEYRYYRVMVTANNGDSYTQIGELYLYSVVPDTVGSIVKTYTPIANGGGYTNHTLRSRHSLSAAGFVGVSKQVRIHVPAQFGDTEWTFVELWIGKATAGGNELDMTGSVQVLFSGSAGGTVPAGGLWSDWVTIAVPHTDDLIISAYTTHGAPPYLLTSSDTVLVAAAQAVGNTAADDIFATAANGYHFGAFGFEVYVGAVLGDFSPSKKITITIPAQGETLTDFPVLLSLTGASGTTGFDCAAVFAELGENSNCIAVEVGSSGVQCFVEIERWDGAAAEAQLWVKVPSIGAADSTVLNLFYDSAVPGNTAQVGAIGSPVAQNVWDAGFIAVYHLSQDPTAAILDSTGHTNDLSQVGLGLANIVGGDVGLCTRFDSGDYAQSALADFSALQTAFTMESYVKWITPGAYYMLSSCGGATTGCIQHCLEASGTYYANSVGGDFVTTAFPASTTDWHHSAQVLNAGTATLYQDGIADPATNAVTVEALGSDRIYLARRFDGYYANYFGREVRFSKVARTAAWLVATHLSLADDLLAFSDGAATALLRQAVDMLYGDLLAANIAAMEMPYSVLFPHLVYTEQIYGIKLGAMLSMYYGDCPILRQITRQYYGDAPVLRRSMMMKYGDLLMLRRAVEMPYVIPKELRSVIEARYSIAGEAVRAFIDQGYDLLDNNFLRQKLEQIYMIQGDGLVKSVGAQVTIGGRVVKCNHVNVESSLDQYCISGEIHLADQSEYVQIADGEEMIIAIDVDGGVDSYHLIVDAKRRSRPGGARITYIVTGLSPAVKLSAPWSLPLLQEFEPGQARDIVNDLVGDLGPVDWQIVDFPVLPDTLYANDEDPITVIRKLTRSAGAIIQSAPDGTIRIIPAYPTSPPQWSTVVPDFYLTERDLVTQDETPVRNPGYNKYLVGNQLTADDRKWTEKRDVTGSIKEVLAFQTPWDWSLPVVLDHSGGDWVAVPEYMGVVEEIYPPASQPAEQVEFVAGFANTARPIYAVPEVNWIREQLGAVSYSEDGKLEAELKTGVTDGYSLAEIRYLTRYHLWRVRDDVAEDVQYILRVADEVTA